MAAGDELGRLVNGPAALHRGAAGGAGSGEAPDVRATISGAPRPIRCACSTARHPEDQEIINGLPKIADFLDEASREHFAQVLRALDACGVAYVVNPRLVRGLDYYTRTTFEFTVPDGSGLGTQNALLGGGRYDGLSEMLGGPKAPGIGFAIGEDRLILTLQAQAEAADVADTKLMRSSLRWAMRAERAGTGAGTGAAARRAFASRLDDGSFRLKKSFEAADKLARTHGDLR